MSENKMTAAPWTLTKHPKQNWIYAVNGAEDGGDIICDQPDMEDSSRRWEGNASAIILSVNNTYGCGVNPEAVPDLLEALKFVRETPQFKRMDWKLKVTIDAAIDKSKLI